MIDFFANLLVPHTFSVITQFKTQTHSVAYQKNEMFQFQIRM